MKFELSSWLQIEGAGPGDSGTYRCIARNSLGSVSASALLGILGAGDWFRGCGCSLEAPSDGVVTPPRPARQLRSGLMLMMSPVCLSTEELSSYLANSMSEMKQLMGAADYDQDFY